MNKQKLIKSGTIDLSKIIKFARRNQIIPAGRSIVYKNYSRLCDSLVKDIPTTSGWYFWVTSREKISHPIYIGKATLTKKNNSLRYRIANELKTERIAFWAAIVGKEKSFNDHHKSYPHGKFDKGAIRAQRKSGARFIFWISDKNVTSSEVNEVERILIDKYEPEVNVQRAKRSRAFDKVKVISFLFKK